NRDHRHSDRQACRQQIRLRPFLGRRATRFQNREFLPAALPVRTNRRCLAPYARRSPTRAVALVGRSFRPTRVWWRTTGCPQSPGVSEISSGGLNAPCRLPRTLKNISLQVSSFATWSLVWPTASPSPSLWPRDYPAQ